MGIVNREWISSIWQGVENGHTIEWAEFEWFALDRQDSIGLLTSAGPGPVPRSVFRDMEKYINVVEFFAQLPRKDGIEILGKPSVGIADWWEAAERGLYGFDFQRDKQGPTGYRMIARPNDILRVEELPGWVREWLEQIRLEQVVFADSGTGSLDLSGTGLEWL